MCAAVIAIQAAQSEEIPQLMAYHHWNITVTTPYGHTIRRNP